MKQRFGFVMVGAAVGALIGLAAWYVLGGGDDDAVGVPEQSLEQWLLLSEQEMLFDLVEAARWKRGGPLAASGARPGMSAR